MHERLLSLLLPLVLVAPTACADRGDPLELADEARAALAGHDHAGATSAYLAAFEATGEDPAHPLHGRLQRGLARADAHVAPARAAARLESWLRATRPAPSATELAPLVDAFVEAGALEQALGLLRLAGELGLDPGPLEVSARRAAEADAGAGLADELASLGYLGED